MRVFAIVFCATVMLPGIFVAHADEAWDHYGGGQHGMQYSALGQIDTENVQRLEEVWRYRTGELGHGHREPFAFEANPILVEGRLYLATPTAIVIALDPANGEEVWRYDPEIDRSKGHAEIANRGVSSWIDPEAFADAACRHRIFVGTLDARLIALDGDSGEPCDAFGDSGEVYLDRDVGAEDGEWVNYTVTSPPVIVDGTLVVGSAIGDNRAVESELGIVRGIDPRTGQERWRWDPIPREPGDPAYATWKPGEAAKAGSANAWAPLAADPVLGLVYVPTGSPSPDFYGGEREGDNLYANSLVALHAATGEVAWYRQLVHHDLWDYDLASQPTLVNLERDGKVIPAVLQGTKMGLIFSFDRATGEPIFAIVERPVPQSTVPGEHPSPTQPFPVAPPPIARHDPVTPGDAWGMVWIDKKVCRRKMDGLRSEGIYTPPSVEGTVMLPGYAGGINWGGIAFDPVSQAVVTFSIDVPMEVALVPRDEFQATNDSGDYDGYEFASQSGTPFGMRRTILASPLGMPCIAPPWGMLASIDMRDGSINWTRKVGTTQDVAPAIVPNFDLGVPGTGGPIVTAGGLIFMAATMDNYLRAFRLTDGATLWEARLPAGGQATPMTYLLEETGRQYVVIAAGGHGRMSTTIGDYVIAYALPE